MTSTPTTTMDRDTWQDSTVPYFCWDRPWTVGDIRRRLAESQGVDHDRLIAWILREAAFRDVWRFLTPQQVAEAYPRISGQLGRWRNFWPYILGAWRELGKL